MKLNLGCSTFLVLCAQLRAISPELCLWFGPRSISASFAPFCWNFVRKGTIPRELTNLGQFAPLHNLCAWQAFRQLSFNTSSECSPIALLAQVFFQSVQQLYSFRSLKGCKCPPGNFCSKHSVDRSFSTEVNSFNEDYQCRRQLGSTGCF